MQQFEIDAMYLHLGEVEDLLNADEKEAFHDVYLARNVVERATHEWEKARDFDYSQRDMQRYGSRLHEARENLAYAESEMVRICAARVPVDLILRPDAACKHCHGTGEVIEHHGPGLRETLTCECVWEAAPCDPYNERLMDLGMFKIVPHTSTEDFG